MSDFPAGDPCDPLVLRPIFEFSDLTRRWFRSAQLLRQVDPVSLLVQQLLDQARVCRDTRIIAFSESVKVAPTLYVAALDPVLIEPDQERSLVDLWTHGSGRSRIVRGVDPESDLAERCLWFSECDPRYPVVLHGVREAAHPPLVDSIVTRDIRVSTEVESEIVDIIRCGVTPATIIHKSVAVGMSLRLRIAALATMLHGSDFIDEGIWQWTSALMVHSDRTWLFARERGKP